MRSIRYGICSIDKHSTVQYLVTMRRRGDGGWGPTVSEKTIFSVLINDTVPLVYSTRAPLCASTKYWPGPAEQCEETLVYTFLVLIFYPFFFFGKHFWH